MDKILTAVLSLKPLNIFMNKLLGHNVTIFMIHRSANSSHLGLSPELLEQCLSYAQKHNYHFASIDEVVTHALNGITPSRPTLCFTLDDGYNDQVAELVPVLLKYNAKPTLYVITDFIDQIDWPWDAKISFIMANCARQAQVINFNGKVFDFHFDTPEARISARRSATKYAKTLPKPIIEEFIACLVKELDCTPPKTAPEAYKAVSWNSLRHYESLGLTVGSHACSHYLFNSLTDEEVKYELTQAQRRLDAELKHPSQVFCYSSGTKSDYSPRHADIVRNQGYLGAVSANPGNTTLAHIKLDPFNILRHSFPHTKERFARYASWIEALRTKVNYIFPVVSYYVVTTSTASQSPVADLCCFL